MAQHIVKILSLPGWVQTNHTVKWSSLQNSHGIAVTPNVGLKHRWIRGKFWEPVIHAITGELYWMNRISMYTKQTKDVS